MAGRRPVSNAPLPLPSSLGSLPGGAGIATFPEEAHPEGSDCAGGRAGNHCGKNGGQADLLAEPHSPPIGQTRWKFNRVKYSYYTPPIVDVRLSELTPSQGQTGGQTGDQTGDQLSNQTGD